jgi:hypothetical protein
MSDFLKDLFGVAENDEPEILNEENKHYRIEELDKSRAFEKIERTVLDGDGQRTETIQSVSKLDCGHMVGFKSAAEFIGRCSFCNSTFCMRCNARCASCGRVGCMNKCMTLIEGTIPICKKCNRVENTKSILASIHNFLAKEVL